MSSGASLSTVALQRGGLAGAAGTAGARAALPGAQQTLAAGGSSLAALRSAATHDPKSVVKEAAKQFEALFMQELMKSMRATTMSSGMMDNNATEMAGGMLDQQYAQQLTGLPGGLADAITRQLERQLGVNPSAPTAGAAGAINKTGAASLAAPHATDGGVGSGGTGLQRAQDFLHQHRAEADVAAQGSGIPADFMLAQAAHETGWGKREIRNADGSSANNLFGIKAGGDWSGPVATATTTEVIDGVAHKVQARFRSYASAQESFRDYAGLIANSARYAGVAGSAGDAKAFAQGLQRAGYATDPDYAGKLGRVINTTLRLSKLAT
jgi:flagellar protein FlgJ